MFFMEFKGYVQWFTGIWVLIWLCFGVVEGLFVVCGGLLYGVGGAVYGVVALFLWVLKSCKSISCTILVL